MLLVDYNNVVWGSVVEIRSKCCCLAKTVRPSRILLNNCKTNINKNY